MKIAYLIAAHDQPTHLVKLVKALSCDWAQIFIHIDRKSDIFQFQSVFKQFLPTMTGITFLPDSQRIAVYWGGFSQVQVALNLMDAAWNSDMQFTRYCLLSGSDFPIQDQDTIRQALSTSTEFIAIDRKLDSRQRTKENRKHLKNIQKVYWRDSSKSWQKLMSGLFPRSTSPSIPIYHGSQWWSLTHGCIAYIRNFLKEHPQYLDFFQYTNCADEMFFHSIIKTSPFAINISYDFEKTVVEEKVAKNGSPKINLYGCHYIDWSTRSRSPKILDIADLEALKQSQALFARKFKEGISHHLIQALSLRLNEVYSS